MLLFFYQYLHYILILPNITHSLCLHRTYCVGTLQDQTVLQTCNIVSAPLPPVALVFTPLLYTTRLHTHHTLRAYTTHILTNISLTVQNATCYAHTHTHTHARTHTHEVVNPISATAKVRLCTQLGEYMHIPQVRALVQSHHVRHISYKLLCYRVYCKM